jgi:hypothetical protein
LLIAVNFSDILRKNNKIFYGVAYLITIVDLVYRNFSMAVPQTMPNILRIIEKPLSMGALSGAIFVVVMYTGALDNRKNYTKKLMSVRAELSILGCIFFLAHTIPYCIQFFKTIDKVDMSSAFSIISVLTILAIIIMLPLWITSYKNIRKKIKVKTWKNLQKLAYVMYLLIYLHISVLFLLWTKKYDKFILYTLVFGIYAVLRIRKYIIQNKKKK